jgi:hypothetical protein
MIYWPRYRRAGSIKTSSTNYYKEYYFKACLILFHSYDVYLRCKDINIFQSNAEEMYSMCTLLLSSIETDNFLIWKSGQQLLCLRIRRELGYGLLNLIRQMNFKS